VKSVVFYNKAACGPWKINRCYGETSQKLTLTLPTSGGRSVGIVRLRTKATELVMEKPSPAFSGRAHVPPEH
jgi:hypothetical protein